MTSRQEKLVREKAYQDEIERRRNERSVEIARQREMAFINFKNDLKSQKPQIEALITKRLVSGKFALVGLSDLRIDLRLLNDSDIESQSKAYQMLSDFYDEIANESGLVRVKLVPNSFNEFFYLTGEQIDAYKSQSQSAIFGTYKDYQDVKRKKADAQIHKLALSLVVAVIFTSIATFLFLHSGVPLNNLIFADMAVGLISFSTFYFWAYLVI